MRIALLGSQISAANPLSDVTLDFNSLTLFSPHLFDIFFSDREDVNMADMTSVGNNVNISHDSPIPGTVHLIDLDGTLLTKHASGYVKEVVFFPRRRITLITR